MQTENKLFEDLSKVATAAMGTLAGVTREVSEDARRRARDFVGTADAIDRDEFEAVKANAAAARARLEGRETAASGQATRERRYPFTLGPEAVLRKLVHACEAHNPHARYPVTLPSHLIGMLRRVLPTRVMDWVLGQVR